jgi:hypothetical protein
LFYSLINKELEEELKAREAAKIREAQERAEREAHERAEEERLEKEREARELAEVIFLYYNYFLTFCF